MSGERPLDKMFDRFLKSPELIKNRQKLSPNYVPKDLPHRDRQIETIGSILASALRGGVPSNILCYGETGTGKTVVSSYVLDGLLKKAKTNLQSKPVITANINCRVVDTHYRILAALCKAIGKKVPKTGLATSQVFNTFVESLDKSNQLLIILLDEIDYLVKRPGGNDVLYALTRIKTRLRSSDVSMIGISNDLKFKELLDPRVLSSLSEEEVVFHPYTAVELQDILQRRANACFNSSAVGFGVINLCAALAAKEHGDARRAIELLRVAAELAEREGKSSVSEDQVRNAQKQIDRDIVSEAMSKLPQQQKMVLYVIYLLEKSDTQNVFTGDVYNLYRELCESTHFDKLTHRRVSDLINELDMLGLVSAKIMSKGRYGRTKKISLSISRRLIQEILEGDPWISKLKAIRLPSIR
ncbi:MAG: ORC1-type DNA replication protein [Promethearchaeota archaeon]|jgi:cell division control protein 6